jgi:hypothetical protein
MRPFSQKSTNMKLIPKQPDYDIIARATPSSMLEVLSIMEQALDDFEGENSEDLGRAKRLVSAMQSAALDKLGYEKEAKKKEDEHKKNLLNPEILPTLLEDGEQAKDLYFSKGILVIEALENGKEYKVDLPLNWTIKRSSVTHKMVLFDHNKRRVGSFVKGGLFCL